MPYTIPTVDQFQARFKNFADADTDLIALLLTEASNRIDNSWREEDYQPAILYLTAHLLSTDNSGEGEEVEVGSANAGAIASESLGGMSISYANGGSSSSGGLSASERYGTTVFGRRFLDLLLLNKSGPVSI